MIGKNFHPFTLVALYLRKKLKLIIGFVMVVMKGVMVIRGISAFEINCNDSNYPET